MMAGVTVVVKTSPPDVAAGTLGNGTTMGPLVPAGAMWMWAAVATDERPEKLSSTVRVLATVSTRTWVTPVAVLAVGGYSPLPVRWATNARVGAASAGGADAITAGSRPA